MTDLVSNDMISNDVVSTAPKPFGLNDQSTIGWSRKLVYELALRLAPVQRVCEAHGLTQADWLRLRVNPVFQAELKRAHDELLEAGAAYRIKAEMLAEDFLDKAHEMVYASHDDVPPAVKRDLIRDMVKAAGLDASKNAEAAAMGKPAVAIQIVLN